MIRFERSALQEKVLNAIANPESVTYPPNFDLLVSDVNIAVEIEKFSLETGQNGALLFDSTIVGRLPREVANAPCLARAYIDGVPVPLFAGRLGFPKISITSTEIIGQSGATFLDNAVLGSGILLGKELLLYAGKASSLMRQVIGPTKVYGHTDYNIQKLDRQLNYDAQFQGFTPDQSVRDVLSRIAQETKCVYRDSPFGKYSVFEAFLDPRLGKTKQSVYEYNVNTEATDFTHQPDTDKMFFDVVIEQQPQLTATPPIQGFRARTPVPYHGMPFLPPVAITDWRQVSDADNITSQKSAQKFARQIASDYGELPETVTMIVSFNPLLQQYDIVHLTESVFVPGGTYAYDWLLVLDSIKHDSEKMTTELSGRGHITKSVFTEDAPISIQPSSPQIAQTPLNYATFDITGSLQLFPERCINAAGEHWAYYDSLGNLVINTDISDGHASINPVTNQLLVEVPD